MQKRLTKRMFRFYMYDKRFPGEVVSEIDIKAYDFKDALRLFHARVPYTKSKQYFKGVLVSNERH